MNHNSASSRFVVCLKNEGNEASLIVRKVYRTLADAKASKEDLIRVIDESGEDYLYPRDYFASVRLPKRVGELFVAAG